MHAVSSDICKQARASQFVVAPPAETPVRVTVRDTVAMSHGNPFDIDDDAFEVWIVDLDCAGLELIEAARVLNSLDRCDEDNMRAKFA